MTSNTTVRELRQGNRRVILQHAYFVPSVSRLELSRDTGLSPATVTSVVNELLVEGVLLETGVAESQGGRPRTILNINPTHGYFIGVDVGETITRIELFDLTLKQLIGAQYEMGPGQSQGEEVAQAIALHLNDVIVASGIQRSHILGVGVGVPGIVERTNDVVMYAPSWGWRAVPFQALLAAFTDLPIYLDNGAKAMAQAELWFGAGRSVESLAVLLIGTGVGAGIITNGRVYRGATNSAGEWGHTKLVLDGWECRCGSRGCLEAYVGAPGLIRRFRELAPTATTISLAKQEASVESIVQAAMIGEPHAVQVLEEVTHYLGASIADLINVFNPQLIVLGGWVGLQLGPSLLDNIRRVVEKYALRQPFDAVRIGLCELGQDAVCMGAVTLALDDFLMSGGKSTISTTILAKSRIPTSIKVIPRPA